jgi:hypothetical protein
MTFDADEDRTLESEFALLAEWARELSADEIDGLEEIVKAIAQLDPNPTGLIRAERLLSNWLPDETEVSARTLFAALDKWVFPSITSDFDFGETFAKRFDRLRSAYWPVLLPLFEAFHYGPLDWARVDDEPSQQGVRLTFLRRDNLVMDLDLQPDSLIRLTARLLGVITHLSSRNIRRLDDDDWQVLDNMWEHYQEVTLPQRSGTSSSSTGERGGTPKPTDP